MSLRHNLILRSRGWVGFNPVDPRGVPGRASGRRRGGESRSAFSSKGSAVSITLGESHGSSCAR